MSVLFDAQEANALNDEIKHKVAEHLFMFCHYNPGPAVMYGSDGRFMQGVLNLYKLLIDCSLAKSVKTICKAMGSWRLPCIAGLNDDIYTSNVLRTAIAHNIDAHNGTGDTIHEYEVWLKQASGKVICGTSDYTTPLQRLEAIGDNAMQMLKEFVDAVAVSTQKVKAIEKWETCIIDFYSKGNGKRIFEGQLRNAYCAAHPNRSSCASSDVARWVQDECQRKGCEIGDGLFDCQNQYCSQPNIKTRLHSALCTKDEWETMLPEGIVQSVIFADFGLKP